MDFSCNHRQAGAALVTALVILLVLSVLGVTAAKTGIFQIRMSSNSQEQAAATQAAQSAINLTMLAINEGADDSVATHILARSFAKNHAGYQTPGNVADPANYRDANAVILCVTNSRNAINQRTNGGEITTQNCAGDDEWLNSALASATPGAAVPPPELPVRALARLFYRASSTRPEDCPMTELRVGMECKFYEIEGRGWLDLDRDGSVGTGETEVVLRQWGVIRNRAGKPL